MNLQMITSQIETILSVNEKVAENAVIISDGGQTSADLVVFLVPSVSTDESVLKKEIVEFILDKTGEEISPSRIFIVEEIPRTGTGKLFRRVLHQMMASKDEEN
ncbi:MAG: acyl-CoA synthetase [Deltaproteobacteria bacterium]|nr:acyl-CoA synthetase [Deltaproteobacteria bacterium]